MVSSATRAAACAAPAGRAAFHPQHLRAVAGQVTHQMAIAAADVDQLFAGHRQVSVSTSGCGESGGVGHGGRL